MNLSLTFPEFGLITNDHYTDLEDYLEPDSFIKVKPDQQFPAMAPEVSCVFDLGGYVDHRLTELLKTCDRVVVPTLADLNDYRVTVRTIREVESLGVKVCVVLNQAAEKDVPLFMDTFGQLGHPLYRVRKSEAVKDMILEKKSVAALAGEGGLRGYNYGPVAEDFRRLYAGLGLVDQKEAACPKKKTA